MVVAAGLAAGLRLHEECGALIAGVRDGRLVPRASFFQQKNLRAAIAQGDPQWLTQHEDVLVFQSSGKCASSAEPTYSQRESVLGQPQALHARQHTGAQDRVSQHQARASRQAYHAHLYHPVTRHERQQAQQKCADIRKRN